MNISKSLEKILEEAVVCGETTINWASTERLPKNGLSLQFGRHRVRGLVQKSLYRAPGRHLPVSIPRKTDNLPQCDTKYSGKCMQITLPSVFGHSQQPIAIATQRNLFSTIEGISSLK